MDIREVVLRFESERQALALMESPHRAYRDATTAARGVTRSLQESRDIARAQETVDTRVTEIEELESELAAELAAVEDRIDPVSEELTVESIRPRRSYVEVLAVMLGWVPEGE